MPSFAAPLPRPVPPSPPPAPTPVTSRPRPGRTLHLAAAIDIRDGSDPYSAYTASYYVDLARLAERGALDFVTLGTDRPASDRRPSPGPGADAGSERGAGAVGGRTSDRLPRPADGAHPGTGGCGTSDDDAALDVFAVLARVAPDTDRIGVVPLAAGGSPSELGLAVATLDWVSHGRAGWTVAVPPEPPPVDRGTPRRRTTDRRTTEQRPVERRPTDPAQARWSAAEAATDAVTDAVAQAQGGPTTPPTPPSGRPVIAIDATDVAAHPTAARLADIAFVRTADPDHAAGLRAELRRRAAETGRDPERLLVLADLRIDLGGGELGPEPGAEVALTTDIAGTVRFRGGPVDLADLIAEWHRAGAVDGFHVRPVEPRRDLERFVNGTAALLQHRGLFRSFHPGTTLREHLGLHRPERRLATVAGGPAS
jgi:alkanesulfonate monooxygenase SsuD/methylene tetrahydromethanopterin reductase-like flavin-dependent oxidoreductase (luciferase family)